MGAVFIAEKTATHQKYAVKFLKEDYARDETYLARFEREVSSLVSIRHPHVVNVYDWWFPGPGQEGKPFVVMELLEGEGLDQLLRRQKILPPSAAVAIMLQTLDGLQAAHRISVIHRDLGPSNVFLATTNEPMPLVKILDFGLARPITPEDEADSNLTRAGTLMGKPAYVAPEMFIEQPLDARSDIFACGMILFRMLAGRTPFRNTQSQTLWMERYTQASQDGELPSVVHFASWVPGPLEQVVARALRRRPEDRYADAADMQAALLAIEGGRLDQAGTRPVDFLRPGPRESSSPPISTSSVIPASTGSTAPRPSVVSSPSHSLAMPPRIPQIQPSSRSTYLALAGLGVSIAAAGALLYFAGVFGGRAGGGSEAVASADAGAAAQPPPVETVGPSPETAAARGMVRLVFEGVPEGGKVSIGSLEITAPPYEIVVEASDRPLPVTVEAPRFRPYRAALTPDGDRTIQVEMELFWAAEAPDAGAVAEDAGAVAEDAGAVAEDAGGRRPGSSSGGAGSSGGRTSSGGGTRPTGRDGGTRPAFVDDPFARDASR
jgi:serine/threonine protein kinase